MPLESSPDLDKLDHREGPDLDALDHREGPVAELVETPAPTVSPATEFSVALLAEFVRLGVRDIVLSPGARSQALALAAADLEDAGALRLHVRIDERGAAFFALGLALETGLPALVICTSGTAVANLHPAVLEAHHSGVPLIVLTADRPLELRGIRSNQTTTQPGIFGSAVRLGVDVPAPTGDPAEPERAAALAAEALVAALGTGPLIDGDFGAGAGPVQLNLAFREPLSAASSRPATTAVPASAASELAASASAQPVGTALPGTVLLGGGLRTVVIAGAGAGSQAEEVARAGGWPLLAEVSSGARFGPNLVVTYRELLADADFGGLVQRAIVFGHPTLSREVPALLSRAGVETIVVAPAGTEFYTPASRLARRVHAVLPGPEAVAEAASRDGRAWAGRWVMTSRALLEADAARDATPIGVRGMTRAELAAMRAPVTRPMLADAVWRASWPHDRLFLGASRLIREADRRVLGKKITVHSNRGLAGIDGTVATALGVALASQAGPEPRSSGVTRLLLGDVTLLHDAGSLLISPGETRPRIQVIVGNDGGGTIFDGLEVARTAPEAAINRVLFTPHSVDLAALAQAYGWEYSLVNTRSDLERALTAPPNGPSILEVPLAR